MTATDPKSRRGDFQK